jgi:uncharacterized protein YfaS (alpha-2-macroglobulin family)
VEPAPAAPPDAGETARAEADWWTQSALGIGLFALAQCYPAVDDGTPVQPADVAMVSDNLERLPEEERVFAALALRAWGRRPEIVQSTLRDVLRRAEVTAATARVAATRDIARAHPFRTAARATSLVLWLAATAAPTEPLVPKLATGLLDMRRNGHWQTTQDDALALLAFAAYRDAVERDGAPIHVQAALRESGTSVASLDAAAGSLERRTGGVDLVPAIAAGGQATLAFAGQGTAHATTMLRWQEPMAAQSAIEAGYTLVRRLRALDDDGGRTLRVGDLVLVTLELVVPRESQYLAIVDPLPAALEIVQPQFRTETQRAAAAEAGREPGFTPLPVSHVERRDRELRVFADDVPAGVYAHRYVARVRAAGGFAHPPAHIEAMYAPELQAATPPSRLRTRAPEERAARASGGGRSGQVRR